MPSPGRRSTPATHTIARTPIAGTSRVNTNGDRSSVRKEKHQGACREQSQATETQNRLPGVKPHEIVRPLDEQDQNSRERARQISQRRREDSVPVRSTKRAVLADGPTTGRSPRPLSRPRCRNDCGCRNRRAGAVVDKTNLAIVARHRDDVEWRHDHLRGDRPARRQCLVDDHRERRAFRRASTISIP